MSLSRINGSFPSSGNFFVANNQGVSRDLLKQIEDSFAKQYPREATSWLKHALKNPAFASQVLGEFEERRLAPPNKPSLLANQPALNLFLHWLYDEYTNWREKQSCQPIKSTSDSDATPFTSMSASEPTPKEANRILPFGSSELQGLLQKKRDLEGEIEGMREGFDCGDEETRKEKIAFLEEKLEEVQEKIDRNVNTRNKKRDGNSDRDTFIATPSLHPELSQGIVGSILGKMPAVQRALNDYMANPNEVNTKTLLSALQGEAQRLLPSSEETQRFMNDLTKTVAPMAKVTLETTLTLSKALFFLLSHLSPHGAPNP